jgi:predicted esterase
MSARCQLVRRQLGARGSAGVLVALHADGADSGELVPLYESLGLPLELVAPQAPRAQSPFHSSPPPDEPRWRGYGGYSWFRRDAAGRPEPASFGDSLGQLEALVAELTAPVYLLGHGEGASLALGAALAFPESLAGVVALGGSPPMIPGWSDELRLPPSLPLLSLDSPDTDPCGAAEPVRAFLLARQGGARRGRSRSQEAGQDLLQAH